MWRKNRVISQSDDFISARCRYASVSAFNSTSSYPASLELIWWRSFPIFGNGIFLNWQILQSILNVMSSKNSIISHFFNFLSWILGGSTNFGTLSMWRTLFRSYWRRLRRPERNCADLVATFEGLKGTSAQVLEKSFGFQDNKGFKIILKSLECIPACMLLKRNRMIEPKKSIRAIFEIYEVMK